MNVSSPTWASVFAEAPQALSPALRAVYHVPNPMPVALQTLLQRLDRRISRESANDR